MQFDIKGMSCAACSARVEKAVSSLSGVETCSVNLLTNSMVVEGTASPEEIISAVTNAGYGAVLNKENKDTTTHPISTKSSRFSPTIIEPNISSSFLFFYTYFLILHIL